MSVRSWRPLRSLVVTASFALAAAHAAAQSPYDPDPTIVVRETVRDVVKVRAHLKEIAHAYQGRDRGPEQTDRFSRRVRLGRDGRVSIQNIAGDITVTAGSGDEVSIEAVKRTRRDPAQLAATRIIVDDRPGRVDVRVEYDRFERNNNVSVDFTVTVPSSAIVDVKSVSGGVKVTGVQGAVRAESVSGNVVTSATPRLEAAKSVSGDIDLTNAGTDADLSASSVSGAVRARGLKARSLELGSVSGDLLLTDVACERLGAKSVSGDIEFGGTLARNGRYDVNTHSGTVRLSLASGIGFELSANTFSGSIRSELPLTIGGDRDADRDGRRRGLNNRAIHATFGDGSAALTIRTFSGDIVITKR
jgi:DUF4097 and DUF4098 domain-containing protein YvlB